MRFFVLAATLAHSLPTLAADSPHLVQAGDRALRSDLQWLADRGGLDISVSSWPLSVAVVRDALRSAERSGGFSSADWAVLRRVERRLMAYHDEGGSLRWAMRTDAAVPKGFSEASHGYGEVQARRALSSGEVGFHVQATGILSSDPRDGDRVSADGSYASVGVANQLLSVGRIGRWWGPGMEGSLILGNTARPFTALSMQRGKELAPEWALLSWIGPWGYQTFLGELSDYQSVPGVRLFGLRLTVRPVTGLELGASRIIQWGGEGRPGGPQTLWNAFVGRDNVGQDSISEEGEPGNQLAGFDMRFTAGSRYPMTFYWQLVGEDEVGRLPSKNSVLLGVESKASVGGSAMTWRIEAADTTAGRVYGSAQRGVMYQHHIYTDGYYHRGQPIGHSIGGDGRLLVLGADFVQESGVAFDLRAMRAEVNETNVSINIAYPQHERFSALALGVRNPTGFGGVRMLMGARKSETHSRTEWLAEIGVEIVLSSMGND